MSQSFKQELATKTTGSGVIYVIQMEPESQKKEPNVLSPVRQEGNMRRLTDKTELVKYAEYFITGILGFS